MKKLLFLAILVLPIEAFCAQDRFGNMRNEVYRSSYTISTESNALISSGPVHLGNVFIFGVIPTTVTFYDTNIFTVETTTKTKVTRVNTISGDTVAPYSLYFSSGLMYSKEGEGLVTIQYDYLTPNTYDRRR